MSCNGCRVLRKGCSESCILRPCLQWIETPEAQGHATVFVAKFFGRAGLMSFISAVPESQRPGSSPEHNKLRPDSTLRNIFLINLLAFCFQRFSFVSISAIRSVRPYGQPGQRGGGIAVDRQLASVPGRGRDRAPGRHVAADSRAGFGFDSGRGLRGLYGHVDAPRSDSQFGFVFPVHQLSVEGCRFFAYYETQAIGRRVVEVAAALGSGPPVDPHPRFQTEAQTRDPTTRLPVHEFRGVGGHHVLRERERVRGAVPERTSWIRDKATQLVPMR